MTDILISLAKAAILVSLNQPDTFDLEHALKTYPALQENAAVFITLTTDPNEQLRGYVSVHCKPTDLFIKISLQMHRLLLYVIQDLKP